jgi:cation-transporting ATPase E
MDDQNRPIPENLEPVDETLTDQEALQPKKTAEPSTPATPKPRKPRVKKVEEVEVPAPATEPEPESVFSYDLDIVVEPTLLQPPTIAPSLGQVVKEKQDIYHPTVIPDEDLSDPNVIIKKATKKTPEIRVRRYEPDASIGLKADEVEARTQLGLVNRVSSTNSKSYLKIITDNVFSIFNISLIGIFGWLVSVNTSLANMAFMVVLVVNISIGVAQEIKAKKMIENLSLLTNPIVEVIRDGESKTITVSEVVIDDVIVLTSGKQIVTDCVVKQGLIEVNEALITGESDNIVKTAGMTLFGGSTVASGRCLTIVTAVGKDNYINKLSNKAKTGKSAKSGLYSQLRIVLTILAVISLGLGAFLFYRMFGNGKIVEELIDGELVTSFARTFTYQSVVQKTAGAIVGMMPAGLLLCTSVSLAVGVVRLVKKNALVQEVYSIETLARVDTLCLDKTGTITDGTMTVREVLDIKNPTKFTVKQIVSAMLNAQTDTNQTSLALLDYFGTGKRMPFVNTIPFSSSRKYQAVEFNNGYTFLLGAPTFVVKDKEEYAQIQYEVERRSNEGYRVLALGCTQNSIANNDISGVVTPISLIVIEDTIRPNAIDTIEKFQSNGVLVRVISGDDPLTVSRIAERAGVKNAHDYISLEGKTETEIRNICNKYIGRAHD